MMFRDEILENERRHKVYSVICENPGIHQRELQRKAGIPLSTLEYHLQYMKRHSVIYEEKSANHSRYFCHPLAPQDKQILLALRNSKLREIVIIILAKKKVKHRFLVENLKLPRSSLYVYLKCLVDSQIVNSTRVGPENIYTIKDEERVAKILIAYKSSLLDDLVNSAAGIWLDTRFLDDRSER